MNHGCTAFHAELDKAFNRTDDAQAQRILNGIREGLELEIGTLNSLEFAVVFLPPESRTNKLIKDERMLKGKWNEWIKSTNNPELQQYILP